MHWDWHIPPVLKKVKVQETETHLTKSLKMKVYWQDRGKCVDRCKCAERIDRLMKNEVEDG